MCVTMDPNGRAIHLELLPRSRHRTELESMSTTGGGPRDGGDFPDDGVSRIKNRHVYICQRRRRERTRFPLNAL